MNKTCTMIALCVAAVATLAAATSGQLIEDFKLLADDGAEDDLFGVSVSISGDTAVIGAIFDDDNGIDSGLGVCVRRSDGCSDGQAFTK